VPARGRRGLTKRPIRQTSMGGMSGIGKADNGGPPQGWNVAGFVGNPSGKSRQNGHKIIDRTTNVAQARAAFQSRLQQAGAYLETVGAFFPFSFRLQQLR